MSGLEYKPFVEPNNVDLFNAIRNNAGYDYQNRIPNADKANVDQVINGLMNYTPSMNEFLFQLVNVIGLQIYKGVDSWTNPLAKFKRGELKLGDTIEEIASGILKAHRYNANAEYLEGDIFGSERPEVRAAFHKINRQDVYKLSINEVELRKAFSTEYGLSEFLTRIMSAPQVSDQLDEFLMTTSLFKKWHNSGGYFNVNVPDISAATSDAADSKYALRRMREMGDTLPFLSTRYNPWHMPMAPSRDELELIITPEANAAMDVEALSGAFNIDKASFDSRKTIVPAEYIGIDGFQAMLTTRDFFVIADSFYDVKSIQNPMGLITNYFLHHHQVISASPFAPAILFTSSEPSTPIVIQEPVVNSVTTPIAKDQGGVTVTSLNRGESYQIIADGVTVPATGANDALLFTITGATSPRTKIWQTGFLTIAIDEAAAALVVTATSVENNALTGSATFDLDGEIAYLWPNSEIVSDADDDGLGEVTPEPIVATDNTVTIPSSRGVQYKKDGVNVANGSVHNLTGSTVFTAVARTGFEFPVGAPVTWTVTAS